MQNTPCRSITHHTAGAHLSLILSSPSHPKTPDYFGDISQTKGIFRKYLKEKCKSDIN